MLFKSSGKITQEKLKTRLQQIIDPKTGDDIVTAGLVSDIRIEKGDVRFVITINAGDSPARQAIQPAAEAAAAQMDGVKKVTAILTATGDGQATPKKPMPAKARAAWNLTPIDGVKKIIAIASGKGGVGKSTTAVGLARAANDAGLKVGLLDADICGPSLPRMMGLKGVDSPPVVDGKIQPVMKNGIACMSIGLLIGDSAAIMRGSMVTKALNQMLRGTAWGTDASPLDVLFIDLPPGTGDVHLSLVQQCPLAANGGGAIIVTTPQEVATEDARKAIQMFSKVDVPVLGIIENMSYFEDPTSGNISRIFGEGGGQALADEANAPLLGEIALDMQLRAAMDAGEAINFAAYKNILSKFI